MAQTISNFQYVGFLSDILTTYNEIDALTDQYKCAKSNFDNANRLIKEYNERFSVSNCLIGWALIFAALLLTFPVLFLPHTNVIVWLVFCALLSGVIIITSKIVYTKKVLPVHRAKLDDERNRAERRYTDSYEGLVARRSNLRDLCDGIEPPCSYPLSMYLMCEAAKEGACSNIPQGIRYFKTRYHTLETAEDEASQALKQRIDAEQEAAQERQAFLQDLDENARSLFE